MRVCLRFQYIFFSVEPGSNFLQHFSVSTFLTDLHLNLGCGIFQMSAPKKLQFGFRDWVCSACTLKNYVPNKLPLKGVSNSWWAPSFPGLEVYPEAMLPASLRGVETVSPWHPHGPLRVMYWESCPFNSLSNTSNPSHSGSSWVGGRGTCTWELHSSLAVFSPPGQPVL